MTGIKIKRVYEQPANADGLRILVDRLWPRGLKKEKARIDLWLKEIAPSQELREWFNHRPEKWVEFQQRYGHELATKTALIDQILQKAATQPVTLLYAAKDELHNNALVLQKRLLESRS